MMMKAILLFALASVVNGRHSMMRGLAGQWVSVQTAITSSNGLLFGPNQLPGGLTISSATLWDFESNGNCSRKGFANIDGTSAELNAPLTSCVIQINDDGTGSITIESPSTEGADVVRIIVVNHNEIVATSDGAAVSAFTFRRQNLRKRWW